MTSTQTKLAEFSARYGADAARYYAEGHDAALQKVSSHIQAEADALYRARLDREKAISAFAGEVLIGATAAELRRIKASAANGICWDCQRVHASPTSPYHRCAHCDEVDA